VKSEKSERKWDVGGRECDCGCQDRCLNRNPTDRSRLAVFFRIKSGDLGSGRGLTIECHGQGRGDRPKTQGFR
jgi:hypothetical protein